MRLSSKFSLENIWIKEISERSTTSNSALISIDHKTFSQNISLKIQ